MKYQNNNSKTRVALISGIAIGLGLLIVYQNRKKIKGLFANHPLLINARKKKAKKAAEKLSQVIEDVRLHVKQNAAGLLG